MNTILEFHASIHKSEYSGYHYVNIYNDKEHFCLEATSKELLDTKIQVWKEIYQRNAEVTPKLNFFELKKFHND